MRTRAEVVSQLEAGRLIAVLRVQDFSSLLPLSQALVAGGISILEVTLTVPNALEAIHQLSEAIPAALVGAGTVLTEPQARAVMEAGASFVVSPALRLEVGRAVCAAGSVMMMGAYSPSEALVASESGADYVKIFPADTLGPAYLKALLAPFPQMKLVPTGGVDESNAAEFLRAGARLLGIGSALTPEHLVKAKNWGEITERAKRLRAVVS